MRETTPICDDHPVAGVRTVFISHASEFGTFPADRSFVDVAIDVIRNAGMSVSEMSHFTARDEAPAEYCRSEVESADVYVGLIGFRYGTPVRDTPELSYTELEFQMASELGLKRLVFMLSEEAHLPRSMAVDPEYGSRQDAFRARLLESGVTCTFIESPDDFGRKLNQALVDLFTRSSASERPHPRRVRPAQLPPASAVFTGRDLVTHEISNYLTEQRIVNGARVVVVTGAGGMGKTTVALHAAYAASREFEHGQLYADLRGNSSDPKPPGEVIGAFLSDLGIEGSNIPESLEGRTRVLRSALATMRVLLFLDNASSEDQVRPMLPGGGESATVVTSRQRLLALAGVRTFELDVLLADDGVGLLEALVGVERCHAEVGAARRIVQFCGGLPLAIAIAGARLASRPRWTLTWFAEQLADERQRLDWLEHGDLAVRTAFELSYRHLGESLQRLFCVLGSWTGVSFEPWLVGAMNDHDGRFPEFQLEALVDAQLLGALEPAADGAPRYRLHDLLRDYARSLAVKEFSAAERDAARRSATQAYASRAGAVGVDLSWLVEHRDGIDAAATTAMELSMPTELIALTRARAKATSWPGDWPAWSEHVSAAIGAAEHLGRRGDRRELLTVQGTILHELGRFSESDTALQLALELATKEERPAVLQRIGDTYRLVGRLEDAIDSFQRILDSTTRDLPVRAAALSGSGDAARGLSRWADASDRLQQAASIYRSFGDRTEVAETMRRLGMVYRDQFRLDDARESFLAAYAIIEHSQERLSALVIRQLGIVERGASNLDEATKHFQDARHRFVDLVDLRCIAQVDRNAGDLLRAAGNFDIAEQRLVAALRQFETIQDVRWTGRCLLSLADTYRAAGEWATARAYWARANEIFTAIVDVPAQARALRSLALIDRDECADQAAITGFREAANVFAVLGDFAWASRCYASASRTPGLSHAEESDLTNRASDFLVRAGLNELDPWKGVWREW